MKAHHTIVAAGAAAATLIGAGHAAAAPLDNFTEHEVIQFTDPGFIGPCDGSAGVLTVDGEALIHVTDTGQTFRLDSTVRGTISIDFADPAETDVEGHFVSMHHINYAQLQDYRVADDTHLVAFAADGTQQPVHTKMTVLYGADGSVEVKIDSTRCGGEAIE
jgi:hypothetical protein